MAVNRPLSFYPAFLILALSLQLVGCSHKNDESEDPLLKAYRLIDLHRTDEAIALMEDKLTGQPENDDYRETLASAYAHKAGIRIQSLAPAVVESKKVEMIEKYASELDQTIKTSDGLSMGSQVYRILLGASETIKNIVQVYSAVPTVSDEQSLLLRHAISLLDGLHKPSSSALLYRSVLRFVFLKYQFGQRFIGEIASSKLESICKVDLTDVTASINDCYTTLSSALNDLSGADPTLKESAMHANDRFRDLISDLTTKATSLSLVDDAAMATLGQSFLRMGLGKSVTCQAQGSGG